MYSLFFDVWDASVFLGGRRLPGAVTERDLHGRRAPSSFLAYVTRASYFRVTYSPHGTGKVLVSETWVSGRS